MLHVTGDLGGGLVIENLLVNLHLLATRERAQEQGDGRVSAHAWSRCGQMFEEELRFQAPGSSEHAEIQLAQAVAHAVVRRKWLVTERAP